MTLEILWVLGGVGTVLAMVELQPLGNVGTLGNQAVVTMISGQVEIEVWLRGESFVTKFANELLQLEVHPFNMTLCVRRAL